MERHFGENNPNKVENSNPGSKEKESVNPSDTRWMYEQPSSGSNMRGRGTTDSGNSSLGMEESAECKIKGKFLTNDNESFAEEQYRTGEHAKASDKSSHDTKDKQKEEFFQRFDKCVKDIGNRIQDSSLKSSLEKELDGLRERFQSTSDPFVVFRDTVYELEAIIKQRPSGQREADPMGSASYILENFTALVNRRLPGRDASS